MHKMTDNTCNKYFFFSRNVYSLTHYVTSTFRWMLFRSGFDENVFTFIFHLISWAPQNQLMLSTFVSSSFIQLFVDMNTQSFNISLRCWNGFTDTGRFSNKTKQQQNHCLKATWSNGCVRWKWNSKEGIGLMASSYVDGTTQSAMYAISQPMLDTDDQLHLRFRYTKSVCSTVVLLN